MTKTRATELITKFPHWSKTELNPDEKAQIWRLYHSLVKGFNIRLSFKTVLEWIQNGEAQ